MWRGLCTPVALLFRVSQSLSFFFFVSCVRAELTQQTFDSLVDNRGYIAPKLPLAAAPARTTLALPCVASPLFDPPCRHTSLPFPFPTVLQVRE